MKHTLFPALAGALLIGCMAPAKSKNPAKPWEIPLSLILLPFDAAMNASYISDKSKANKGDAKAALHLARAHLDWGENRSYFEHHARHWYVKAQELQHPNAQKPYEQWREKYKPPVSSTNNYGDAGASIWVPLIFGW